MDVTRNKALFVFLFVYLCLPQGFLNKDCSFIQVPKREEVKAKAEQPVPSYCQWRAPMLIQGQQPRPGDLRVPVISMPPSWLTVQRLEWTCKTKKLDAGAGDIEQLSGTFEVLGSQGSQRGTEIEKEKKTVREGKRERISWLRIVAK